MTALPMARLKTYPMLSRALLPHELSAHWSMACSPGNGALLHPMQLRSGSGPSVSILVPQYAGILVDGILPQMLCHQVCWVLGAENFGKFHDTSDLLLLQPEYTYVEVSYSPDALAFQYAKRRLRVDVQPDAQGQSEVIGK